MLCSDFILHLKFIFLSFKLFFIHNQTLKNGAKENTIKTKDKIERQQRCHYLYLAKTEYSTVRSSCAVIIDRCTAQCSRLLMIAQHS